MKWWIFSALCVVASFIALDAKASVNEPWEVDREWSICPLSPKPEIPLLDQSSDPNENADAVRPNRRKLDRREHRYRTGWARIIPTHVKWQYAGGMGYMSFGCGWDYGKKSRWETDLFFGFLPKSKADKFYLTATLKQNYIPWNIAIKDRFSVDPFYCGMYINTIFGRQFWVKQPDRFPKKYYTFSTKMHTYFFIGQRFTVNTNIRNDSRMKGVTFYYELSTCDLYLFSALGNKYLSMKDIMGISFGIKLQLF